MADFQKSITIGDHIIKVFVYDLENTLGSEEDIEGPLDIIARIIIRTVLYQKRRYATEVRIILSGEQANIEIVWPGDNDNFEIETISTKQLQTFNGATIRDATDSIIVGRDYLIGDSTSDAPPPSGKKKRKRKG